jgi:hypothetical protein
MITQVLVMVDRLDDETTDDIQKMLDSLPIANGADIIINDSVDSAINILRTLNVSGVAN